MYSYYVTVCHKRMGYFNSINTERITDHVSNNAHVQISHDGLVSMVTCFFIGQTAT